MIKLPPPPNPRGNYRGYIRSTPDFEAHPQVMDAASDLLVSVLGQRGQHARAALGVASLPGGGLVEIELSAGLKP